MKSYCIVRDLAVSLYILDGFFYVLVGFFWKTFLQLFTYCHVWHEQYHHSRNEIKIKIKSTEKSRRPATKRVYFGGGSWTTERLKTERIEGTCLLVITFSLNEENRQRF